jgi:hypothetical protein
MPTRCPLMPLSTCTTTNSSRRPTHRHGTWKCVPWWTHTTLHMASPLPQKLPVGCKSSSRGRRQVCMCVYVCVCAHMVVECECVWSEWGRGVAWSWLHFFLGPGPRVVPTYRDPSASFLCCHDLRWQSNCNPCAHRPLVCGTSCGLDFSLSLSLALSRAPSLFLTLSLSLFLSLAIPDSGHCRRAGADHSVIPGAVWEHSPHPGRVEQAGGGGPGPAGCGRQGGCCTGSWLFVLHFVESFEVMSVTHASHSAPPGWCCVSVFECMRVCNHTVYAYAMRVCDTVCVCVRECMCGTLSVCPLQVVGARCSGLHRDLGKHESYQCYDYVIMGGAHGCSTHTLHTSK